MSTNDDWMCHNCPNTRILDPHGIAEALPLLGTVVSVTANDAALLSHTGDYLPVSLPGEALQCTENHINVRLYPEQVKEAALTPRALTLSDEAGYHRAHFTPFSDRLAFDVLDHTPTHSPYQGLTRDWSRTSWRESDFLTHLDALTLDRFKVLPFTGSYRIDPTVLPSFFQHAADYRIPFTLAVPGGGCVQLHRGSSIAFCVEEDHLTLAFSSARYVVAPYFVSECWVTYFQGPQGVTSSLELYDHQCRCVSVLTQTGLHCAHVLESWEGLLASLPHTE